MRHPTRLLAGLTGMACLAMASTLPLQAHADSKNLQPATLLPAYKAECAACHQAYPPGMLPARSWARIMGGLDKHYGTDASLDEATVRQIGAWLQTHAGTYKRVGEEPPQDRITTSAWFVRKHREVAPDVWKRASIGSRANCAACHTRAPEGNYDEHFIRIPK